ncbi:MAG: InlB B-repeat-containing protein [Lachnospiraceae bacterium]|nr:InlB B-repeat-containing protein [Lachnospiraceae bacterium]
MNQEIKKRKKRFAALCLVLMFVLVQGEPSTVQAAEYTIIKTDGGYLLEDAADSLVQPEDVIYYNSYVYNVTNTTIYYLDSDGTELVQDSVTHSNTSMEMKSFIVKSYSEVSGTQMPEEQFKAWELTVIAGSGDCPSAISLKAVAYTQSSITYELNGGTNASTNPNTYYEGKEAVVFADASKTGYTFEGWYSDANFTTQVTAIPITQTGAVNLCAKFTPNTYGITYELNGGSVTGNPSSYTYGVGVESFADASKTGYTFEGWYSDANFTTQVTAIPVTQMGAVNLYAKFTKIIKDGTGSVTVSDVYYGKVPEPVITSATNGTDHVTIEYKQKDASDDTYTSEKPTKVGEYTVRAIFAETSGYRQVTATDNFSIHYLNAPESPYSIIGTKGENNYYTSKVTILPPAGYSIADSLDGTYKEKLEITTSLDEFYVYLMDISTGEKTTGIKVSAMNIDTVAPVIQNLPSEKIIYGDQAEIIIEDENLKQVLVNGETVTVKNGKAVLQLDSNQGEEQYEIICVDNAGNKSETNLVVAAEWMKTKVIPSGVKVKLYKKYSYTLGSGTWKVTGDDTVYAGGATFYVNSDGEYTFTSQVQ